MASRIRDGLHKAALRPPDFADHTLGKTKNAAIEAIAVQAPTATIETSCATNVSPVTSGELSRKGRVAWLSP